MAAITVARARIATVKKFIMEVGFGFCECGIALNDLRCCLCRRKEFREMLSGPLYIRLTIAGSLYCIIKLQRTI